MALVALPFLMGASCEAELGRDSSFDLWCGDTLCAWTIAEGAVQRAGTWHEGDPGVELVGDPVVLTQVIKGAMYEQCLHFYVMADLPETAQVTIVIDEGPNVPLKQLHVPNARFEAVRLTRRRGAGASDTPTVRLEKRGAGRVVMGQLRVTGGCDYEGE
jgi:hypothetical protein